MLTREALRAYKMKLVENEIELNNIHAKSSEIPRNSGNELSKSQLLQYKKNLVTRKYLLDILDEEIEASKMRKQLLDESTTVNQIPDDSNIKLYENNESNDSYIETEYYKLIKPYLPLNDAQDLYMELIAIPGALRELVYNWNTYKANIETMKGEIMPRKVFKDKIQDMLIIQLNKKNSNASLAQLQNGPGMNAQTDEERAKLRDQQIQELSEKKNDSLIPVEDKLSGNNPAVPYILEYLQIDIEYEPY